MKSLFTYFSTERKAARLEKELLRASQGRDQQKVIEIFRKGLLFLLKEKNPQLLSKFVHNCGPEIDASDFENANLPSGVLDRALSLLRDHRLFEAAFILYNLSGRAHSAIDLLARLGRAEAMMAYLTRNDVIAPGLLQTAITSWEKYQGDIRINPTMRSVLSNYGKSAPQSIPDNPRVKELVGQFAEAAILYRKEGNLSSAAECYQQAGMCEEAIRIYEEQGDFERASLAAEAMGNLDKALKYVMNPERKVNLLIRKEQLSEAWELAAGLPSRELMFDSIQNEAKKLFTERKNRRDFPGAMELADLAECSLEEREEILSRGRVHLDQKITAAPTREDILQIVRDKVRLLEMAGQFQEAGRMAEEVLEDLSLASLLYEKANLFDRAIHSASETIDGQENSAAGRLRLAELHRKGGNLLKAAQLFESAGRYDNAFELYEKIQNFTRALECYQKITDQDRETLIRLYTGAGEFEKVIEILSNSGDYADLERALSIANTRKLSSHARAIQDKLNELVPGNEKDLERCFNEARDEVLASYSPTFGIDFGTTNSVAAVFNKNSKKVEIVLNSRGFEYEPSLFGLDEQNRPIFGEAARLRSITATNSVVARVKRSLGEEKQFWINGQKFRSEEIIAKILQQLRLNTEAYLQAKVETRLAERLEKSNLRYPGNILREFLNRQKGYCHVQDVVLTVPAYFNDNQKRATRDSAEIAGLNVQRLLHEPTAAALAYGYRSSYSGKLAVIDLGGGTLDISIVEIGDQVYQVQAIGGDTKLGGSDIDTELLRTVMKNIHEIWGIDLDEDRYPLEISRLRDACERLKIELSTVTEASFELQHFLNNPQYIFSLTRQELEQISKPILDRFAATLERTIKEYGSTIDNYLLVGNACRMPAIDRLAKQHIPGKHLKGIDPGIVVATGAALEGAVLSGDIIQALLIDVVPYSLGIAVIKKTGSEPEKEYISRLINKHDSIPIRKTDTFTTKEDNQANVHIRIYQGEAEQPQKNYFLGDFRLEGIPPAPAGTPQIDVTFDIGVDCILTVKAVDKATRNERSIKIDGAVVLSPAEKQKLSEYFSQNESLLSLEDELKKRREDIETSRISCEETIRTGEQLINRFFELFTEKVEGKAHLYQVNSGNIHIIQEMFIQKDQFFHGIPKYHDQLTTINRNLRETESKSFDYRDHEITSKLKARIHELTRYQEALTNLIKSLEMNVNGPVTGWVQILETMEPDFEKLSPFETAQYHFVEGRIEKARLLLESMAASSEGLTREAFQILLKCYVRLGLKEEYRDVHKRLGGLFGMEYPDFNRLNAYLKIVDSSIFMIQGVDVQQQMFSGSGFAIAKDLIVTNRHVVENMISSSIQIIGKQKTFHPSKVALDPMNDIAILEVKDEMRPLRIGEFDFVEPGESILAIGFAIPESNRHSEEIYISKGIINSIRSFEGSSDRVIYIDAKIGSGMSGGPLINELGEVVGIVTMFRESMRTDSKGVIHLEQQPAALPIYLVRKFIR